MYPRNDQTSNGENQSLAHAMVSHAEYNVGSSLGVFFAYHAEVSGELIIGDAMDADIRIGFEEDAYISPYNTHRIILSELL